MGWVNPTSNVANGWADPTYAYDDETTLYASYTVQAVWSPYLELYISEIQCDKVQAYCSIQNTQVTDQEVGVYYSSAWHNIYSGAPQVDAYYEYAIGSEEAVTGVRFRFNSSKTSRWAGVNDVDFNQIVGGQDYPISTSCGLTSSATVAYQVAFDRGMNPGLAASTTVARALACNRALAPDLSASVTVAKAFGKLVTSSAGLAVSITVDRTLTFARVVSSGITIISSILRSVAWHWTNKSG